MSLEGGLREVSHQHAPPPVVPPPFCVPKAVFASSAVLVVGAVAELLSEEESKVWG